MTQKQNKLQLIRLADVSLTPVRWLWHPYIPFGKITIVQGNPGEGKTTLALWLAAACSRGQTLPGTEPQPPFTILYQTAEDGLGDTIKPRLMSAGADLSRIICIDETERSLSLLDERIGQAGISRRTLDIAKKNMADVVSKKVGGHWVWMLKC